MPVVLAGALWADSSATSGAALFAKALSVAGSLWPARLWPARLWLARLWRARLAQASAGPEVRPERHPGLGWAIRLVISVPVGNSGCLRQPGRGAALEPAGVVGPGCGRSSARRWRRAAAPGVGSCLAPFSEVALSSRSTVLAALSGSAGSR